MSGSEETFRPRTVCEPDPRIDIALGAELVAAPTCRELVSVAACLAEVRASLPVEPGLVVVVDAEPVLPMLQCSRLGLHEAVLSLVADARDALQGRGLISISAKRGLCLPPAVGLRVSYGRRSMPWDAIMTAFPRARAMGVWEGGRGLAAAARFARAARGRLEIESEQGGARVTLWLPAALSDRRRMSSAA